jgi:hypothetical protein
MGQKMEATISPEMLVPTSQSRLTTSWAVFVSVAFQLLNNVPILNFFFNF